MRTVTRPRAGGALAITFALLVPLAIPRCAEAQAPQPTQAQDAQLSSEQLDALVAPIALYPDPLLAQVLAASTYPLEIVQLQQWLAQNAGLRDQALVDAVEKQSWDPSVQALAALPDAVKLLTQDIKWTTDLGNAFLAQQQDVMTAVQRMRVKAKNKGTLQSSDQLKVVTETVDNQPVVVIEQANPEVVYVPSYNPTVVYGAAAYPYPSLYYPGAGLATAAISFGAGVAMGALFSGGWGWGAHWGGYGHNDININRNNTFNRNASVRSGEFSRGGNTWQHNPQHRGGTPYGDRASASRFGGTTRGASASERAASARQQQGFARERGGGVQGGGQQRAAPAGGARGGGGGERVGNRSVGGGGGGGGASAFGGGSRGSYSGGAARQSSARGGASRGGSYGGGGRGGGGARGGGGGRGGGGRGGRR